MVKNRRSAAVVALAVLVLSLLAVKAEPTNRILRAQEAPGEEKPDPEKPKDTPDEDDGSKADEDSEAGSGIGGVGATPRKADDPPAIIPQSVLTDQVEATKLMYGNQKELAELLDKALKSKVEADVIDALKLIRKYSRLAETAHFARLLKDKNEQVAALAGALMLSTGDPKSVNDVFARWKKSESDAAASVYWHETIRNAPCSVEVLANLLKLAKAEERAVKSAERKGEAVDDKQPKGIALEVLRTMLDASPSADCKALEDMIKEKEFAIRLRVRTNAEKRATDMAAILPMFQYPMPKMWAGNMELSESMSILTDFTRVKSRNSSQGLEITFRLLIERDTDEVSIHSDHDDSRPDNPGTAQSVWINGRGRCLNEFTEARKAPVKGTWITVRYAWMPRGIPDGSNKLFTFNGLGPDGAGAGYYIDVGNLPPKLTFRCESGRVFLSVGSVKVISSLP